MVIHERKFKQSGPFAQDFVDDFSKVAAFFSYDVKQETTFEKRKTFIEQRTYHREALVETLVRFNEKYNGTEKVRSNIEKLRRNDALVVVGGQQAGVLTGPALVIYKAISILRLAKEQEEKLGVPVIPVFWIAGEDHDFDEVNHIFLSKEQEIVKHSLEHLYNNRQAVSTLLLPKEKMVDYIDEALFSYGEREYTKELREMLLQATDQSVTYTDFFAHLMMHLFGEHGLVLLDANDPHIRALERGFFREIIEKNESLHEAVYKKLEMMERMGYPLPFEKKRDQANLFMFLNGERYLLERVDGAFQLKNTDIRWSKEQLLDKLETEPALFSNNVVTRPLMQEYVLPTLAFIGGPGEIHYWGTLKEAFEVFSFEMPPVCMRLSYSIIERHIAKWMEELQITEELLAEKNIQHQKDAFISSVQSVETETTLNDLQQAIQKSKEQLQQVGGEVDPTLIPFIEHASQKMWREAEGIKRRIKQQELRQHEQVIQKYHAIEKSLLPQNIYQERFWSIWYYINAYGLDLVDRLVHVPVTFDELHKIVYV
ncbi:bacillithiol biosynthesis cysteine-adding enzyme BshC [Massilibacterium senegalense]|uniref:bacillithiol biosynthesis cysteine-adding enzyme BshC n=1 Tax=Massilibacterium senegalense TaxID=1632858 RepID=UPI0007860B95|nr:bacillithiol biosynthesis cysteine-adding enzyme BshC [Massilibacterium senegalense]